MVGQSQNVKQPQRMEGEAGAEARGWGGRGSNVGGGGVTKEAKMK